MYFHLHQLIASFLNKFIHRILGIFMKWNDTLLKLMYQCQMPQKIKIPNQTSVQTIDLALDTIKKEKQALVFVNTKKSAEKTAEEISLKIKIDDEKLNELSKDILNSLSKPTKQCERLAKIIKKGIAFHHAGLLNKQKTLIENNFRSGLIKIICATPTLAMGVDLPAFRSIIKDLKRYGHQGLSYIPVLEYLQMAGRAGRPKFDNAGEAICIAASEYEKKEIKERYIDGQPEDIYSKIAVEPVLRTYVLSLIASDLVSTRKEIFDFFSKTFWAFQFADTSELHYTIEKTLTLLEEWKFLEGDGTKKKNEHEKYKSTMLGKRISELYIDPLTAYNFVECIKKASEIEITPFSFLQMISNSRELKPLLKVKMKEYIQIQQELIKYNHFLLEEEPNEYELEYEDFLNSIKTALFFQEWIEEKDEEYILEKYGIRPGEINVKLDTANWLLYTAEEIARISRFQPLLKELIKLRIRVKNGVKEELIPLLRLAQVGRARARKLYANKIKTIGDVREADLQKLAQILGKNIALTIKKQVE